MEVLVYFGFFAFIMGGVGMLVAAFRTSVLWGLGCLFITPVSLVFLVTNWSVARNPFFLQLLGVCIMLLGASGASE